MKRWIALFLAAMTVLPCISLSAAYGEPDGLPEGVLFESSFEEYDPPEVNEWLGGEGVYRFVEEAETPQEPEEPEEPQTGAEIDLSSVSASPHYSNHVVANLFDSNPKTKYLVMDSSTATVSFALKSTVTVTSYALTSANDHDPRDPKDWDFYGSSDGVQWTLLDSRRGEDFAARYQTNTYSFSNAVPYLWYKLDILSNNGKDAVGKNIVQFSELLVNPPVSDDTETGFTVVKSTVDGTTGLSGEEKINLFDRNPETKLVVQSETMWVSFGIAEPETVTGYRMVSANDWQARDPKTWTVYGSYDKTNWTPIDHREDQVFPERYQSKLYRLDQSVCYDFYKLEVTEKYGANAYLQLSDFTLLTAAELPEYVEGMDAVRTSGVSWSGSGALTVSGVRLGKENVFARTVVFDGLSVEVSENTVFSYLIRPERRAGDPYDHDYTSCRVILDLHFTDGTFLSGLCCTDRSGAVLSPEGQAAGKALAVGQWNEVLCPIGAAADKTVDRIDACFEEERAEGSAAFIALFDDLKIENVNERPAGQLSDCIDILAGTNNEEDFRRGALAPLVTLPNGFVSSAPVTVPGDGRLCYNYYKGGDADPLDSISLMRPLAEGGASGILQFMPNTSVDATKTVTSSKISSSARKAAFTHEDEEAHAHCYSVTLADGSAASGVRIDTVPTLHGAVLRFTFPEDAQNVNMIIDDLWESGSLTFCEDGRSFEATVNASEETFFIAGVFDAAWTTARTFKSKQGMVSFARGTSTLTLAAAVSRISTEQAKRNLALETGEKTFDGLYAEAQNAWDDLCGRFAIEGATAEQLSTFCTCVYRTYVFPALLSENEGTNENPLPVYLSNGVKKSGVRYTGTLDDTVWAAYRLFTPEKARAVLAGLLPEDGESAAVSATVYADALEGGFLSDDGRYFAAYHSEASRADAGNADVPFLGFVPNDRPESFTASLALYERDFALMRSAELLGLADKAEYYRAKCLQYSLLYNKKTGFFMGRSPGGVYSAGGTDYDPAAWNGPKDDYAASNGWSNLFPAYYDGEGLAALFGGKEALTAKLDALFDGEKENLERRASDGGREVGEFLEIKMGQYAFTAPEARRLIFAYAFSSAPYRIAELSKEILDRLYLGRGIGQGYFGDEGNGSQSAFYLFSALGFFPVCPASGEYTVSSPLFEKVTLHLDGGDLVLSAPGKSKENIYVSALLVNGAPVDRLRLTADDLAPGGSVTFAMSALPSAPSGNAPYSLTAGNAATPADLTDGALVTNENYARQRPSSDSQIYSGVPLARDLFDNDGTAGVYFTGEETVVLTGRRPHTVGFVTLTCPDLGDAPTAVTLEASDNGTVYKTLFTHDLSFAYDGEILALSVPEELRGSYRIYRLSVDGGTLSQIEFFGTVGETFENPLGHFIFGDVNGDGKVNIEDVTALLDFLTRSEAEAQALFDAGTYLEAALDLTGDRKIGITDVTALLDYLSAGISTAGGEEEPAPPAPFDPQSAYDTARDDVLLTVDYADAEGERIEGAVSVSVSSSSAYGKYTLYYGGDDGVLDGCKPLGSATVSSAGKQYVLFTASALNAPPRGAKAFLVTDASGGIAAYSEIPAHKRDFRATSLTFAAISDVHVFENAPYGGAYDDINGDEDLARAVEVINAAGVDFTAITGDLILSFMDNEAQIRAELVKSTGVLAGLEAPCYVVKGNHDKKVNEAVWKELTGCELDYAFTCGGARFIFMSLKTAPDVGSIDEKPYGQAKLDWLENELTENAGNSVYLFMHYPVSGYAGLTPGSTYGFSAGSAEEARLLSLIETHGGVTAFNGHTHYNFASARTYPDISVSRVGQTNSYFVHLPSVAYPRNASNVTVTAESEGYFATLCKNGLLLEGVDFVSGMLDPAAVYYLDTRVPTNALTNDAMLLSVGEEELIGFKAPYESASFRSLNEAVATVDENGKVTATGEGGAVICCTVDGFTLRLTVRVVSDDGAMRGSGTKTDPYIVTTAEHFVYIQNEFRNGNTLSGVYFALGNDVRLNDSPNYRPAISSEAGTFAGFFDGRGHVLSAVTGMSSEDFAVPFFYHLTGTVINTVFECDMGGCAKTSYVVARTMNGGKLVNCIVRGSVYASNVNTSIVCGTSSKAVIANCFINVTVSGKTPGASESGITMKGSGTIVNDLYVPNGCTAQFGEKAVLDLGGVAAAMNGTLSSSASSAGIEASLLRPWQTVGGAPELVAEN
ncbi:MAG: GH92 family glycosyl hydrolase [Clostridia bacterium]|nr:GH92 family glycosyl hydrolase [Clostridia bacterium]